MSIWFISDPHWGHKRIIEYENRPFVDTEHMDNVIIENYNNTIKEGDTVFWLGDMFFCNSSRMEYIASRLTKGRNILIRGNHDKGISDNKFLRLGFLPHRMYLFHDFLLTHKPISESNMRLLETVGVRKNIHGHTHSTNTNLDPTKWQCVSVEMTGYKPVGLGWVMAKYSDGKAMARMGRKARKQMRYGIMEFGDWRTERLIKVDCNELAEHINIGSSIMVKGIGLIKFVAVFTKGTGDKIYVYDKLAG